jgi:hypothetical protein
MSTQPGKDVIYVDIDDEITALIDKLRNSGKDIVALVLPKRATVLQSIVNMKLLKRAADNAKKNLVLVTTETGLLPLAGAVGIHVAQSPQSKPEIPPTGAPVSEENEIAEESVDMSDEDQDKPLDKSRPIGEYVAPTAATIAAAEEEPIELDNNAEESTAKNKKLKVPNFTKFRLFALLGVFVLVAIIVLWYFAFNVLPKASILIKTDSTTINSSIALTLNPTASSVNATAGVLPDQTVQVQKTLTGQVSTTGQKNEGNSATGSVTLVNCSASGSAITIPAGTGLTTNNLTYITQSTAQLPTSTFDKNSNCKPTIASSQSVDITAQNPGAAYNTGTTSNPTSFTVAGQPNVQASGSASGGTDNVVQTATQADITNAEQKLGAADTSSVKQQLAGELVSKGLYAVQATFTTGTPTTTTSVNAGDQATTVTATETITYTMAGVKQSDLQQVVAESVDQQINPNKQSILDYGLSSASYSLQGQPAVGSNALPVSMQVSSMVGSALNTSTIKQEVAGKKTADATSIIENNPGVTNVTVKYSPFWVSSIPQKTSKITVTVEKPAS